MTQEIQTKCDWNPKTQNCSYPGEDEDIGNIWGGENCQFCNNGECAQAIDRIESIETLNQLMKDFHANWKTIHGETFAESQSRQLS